MIVFKEKGGFCAISLCKSYWGVDEKGALLDDNVNMWKVKGEKGCYVLTPMSSALIDALRYQPKMFKGITDFTSVVTNFIPKLKELAKSMGFLSDKGEILDWPRLVIVKGDRAFSVNCYGIVQEVDDFITRDIFLDEQLYGCLEGVGAGDIRAKVLEAIEWHSRWMHENPFPILMLNTRTGKRQVLTSFPKCGVNKKSN